MVVGAEDDRLKVTCSVFPKEDVIVVQLLVWDRPAERHSRRHRRGIALVEEVARAAGVHPPEPLPQALEKDDERQEHHGGQLRREQDAVPGQGMKKPRFLVGC